MVVDQYHRELKDLRVSVTDRCNFRCRYCMPQEVFRRGYPFLKPSALLTYEEIVRIVGVFIKLGVSKIRLTGGEPLLRKELDVLITRLKMLSGIEQLAITTNASLLDRAMVKRLKQAGLDRINISLDAITPEIYRRINPIKVSLKKVFDGINYALDADFDSVKVNMVVQKGVNEADIIPMVEYFRGSGVVLRFIEFMDVGNYNKWSLNQVMSAKEIICTIEQHYSLQPLSQNYRGEVAKRWRYEDGLGEIGVIASITQPFCGDCSRARLSAIGELYTCLFATNGTDLRAKLRSGLSDEQLLKQIEDLWFKRDDRYSMDREFGLGKNSSSSVNTDVIKRQNNVKVGVRFQAVQSTLKSSNKVEMSYIGG